MPNMWDKLHDHLENGSGPMWTGVDYGTEFKPEENKMKIDRVTMTGPDDSIDPKDLIAISEKYPFVEWGILFSQSQQGSPRFPHLAWVEAYCKIAREHGFRSSAHLCGKDVRALVLDCEPVWWRRLNEMRQGTHIQIANTFQRVQLNFHAETHKPHELMLDKISRMPHQFILQMDGVNELLMAQAHDKCISNIVPLFDLSGGAGVIPESWPVAIEGVYCGYAGDLGPETLEAELVRISEAAKGRTIWIDMETRIRSDNDKRFDLEKVVKCLEIAEKFGASRE